MEEKYSKDFLIAEFTGQIKTTEENLVKLREEIARQSQQLVRLNGALEGLNMLGSIGRYRGSGRRRLI